MKNLSSGRGFMEPASSIPQNAITDIDKALDDAKKTVDTDVNERLKRIAAIVENWSAYLYLMQDKKKSLSDMITQIGKNQGSVDRKVLTQVRNALDLLNANQPMFKCVFLKSLNKVLKVVSAIGFSSSPSPEQVALFKKKFNDLESEIVNIEGLELHKRILLGRDVEHPEEILSKKRFYEFFELVSNILSVTKDSDWGTNWLVVDANDRANLIANTTENYNAPRLMCAALERLKVGISHWSGFIVTGSNFKKSIEGLIEKLEKRFERWTEGTSEAEQAKACFEEIKKVMESLPENPRLVVRYLDENGSLLACRACSREDDRGNEIWDYASNICNEKDPLYLPDFRHLEMGFIVDECVFHLEANACIPKEMVKILMHSSRPSFQKLSSEWEIQFRSSVPGVFQYVALSGLHMCLLAYHSQVIEQMLHNPVYRENQERRICFEAQSYNAFEVMIRILLWEEGYSSITWENFMEVLSLANFLELKQEQANGVAANVDRVRDACGRWFELKQSEVEKKLSEILKLLEASVNFRVPKIAETLWISSLRTQVEASTSCSDLKAIAAVVHTPESTIYNTIAEVCLAQLRKLTATQSAAEVLKMLKFACSQRSKKASQSITDAYGKFIDSCMELIKGKKLNDSDIEDILRFTTDQNLQEGLDPITKEKLEALHQFAKTKLNEGLPGIDETGFVEALKNRFKFIGDRRYEELRKNCEQRVSEYLQKNPSEARSFKDVPLQTLSLRGSQLNDKQIAEILSNLAHLKVVDLSGCIKITGLCLEKLRPCVEDLDLSGCSNLVDESIKHIGRLTHLVTLNLKGCKEINGSGFKDLKLGLRVLSLEGCSKLKQSNLCHLGAFPLEELNLNSSRIRDDVLEKFFEQIAATLTKLSIKSSLNLLKAVEKLNRLEFFDASGCTNMHVTALPNSLKRVTFTLGDTPRLEDEDLARLKNLQLEHLTVEISWEDLMKLLNSLEKSHDTLRVLNIITGDDIITQELEELKKFKLEKISIKKRE